MKRIISAVIISAFFLGIYSCNNSSTEKGDTNEALSENLDLNCDHIGNLIIDSAEAYKMKLHFNQIFRNIGSASPKNALLDSFWIDGIIISQLGAFLDTESEIDGVRILMSASETPDEITYPGQQYKHESSLILVLTKPGTNSAGENIHKASWKTKFPFNSTVPPSFKNFNLDSAIAAPIIQKFGEQYRQETDPGRIETGVLDSLSSSIWIDKCVFTVLSKLINDTTKNLDGVNICVGAYNKFDTLHIGQLRQNQSTVIIVPTTNRISNWQVIKKTYKIRVGFGYNHGELCPSRCGDE